MSNVLIRVTSSSKSGQTLPVTQSHTITAEKGASYSLIDASTEQPIDGLMLKKQGDSLLIEVNDEVLAKIDEFYRPGQQATFNTGDISSSGDTIFISSTDSAADDSGVVWQASEISGLAAGDETGVSTTGLVLGGLAVVGVAAALSSSGGGGGSVSDVTVPDVTPPPVAPVPPPVVADTTIVVFDLVGGTSSDHSGRKFEANVDYDIFIIVNSTSSALLTDGNSSHGAWGVWADANKLDGGDKILLVGSGSTPLGLSGSPVNGNTGTHGLLSWHSGFHQGAVWLWDDGIILRLVSGATAGIDLWDHIIDPFVLPTVVADTASSMQGTIMTTQGLA